MPRNKHHHPNKHHSFAANEEDSNEDLYQNQITEYIHIFMNEFLPNKTEFEKYLVKKNGLNRLHIFNESQNSWNFTLHDKHREISDERRHALEKAVEEIGWFIVNEKPEFLGALLYIKVEIKGQEKEDILLCLKQNEDDTSLIELAVLAVLVPYSGYSGLGEWVNHPSSATLTKISTRPSNIHIGLSFYFKNDQYDCVYVNDLNHWLYSDTGDEGPQIKIEDHNHSEIKKTLDDVFDPGDYSWNNKVKNGLNRRGFNF